MSPEKERNKRQHTAIPTILGYLEIKEIWNPSYIIMSPRKVNGNSSKVTSTLLYAAIRTRMIVKIHHTNGTFVLQYFKIALVTGRACSACCFVYFKEVDFNNPLRSILRSHHNIKVMPKNRL